MSGNLALYVALLSLVILLGIGCLLLSQLRDQLITLTAALENYNNRVVRDSQLTRLALIAIGKRLDRSHPE